MKGWHMYSEIQAFKRKGLQYPAGITADPCEPEYHTKILGHAAGRIRGHADKHKQAICACGVRAAGAAMAGELSLRVGSAGAGRLVV